MDSENTPPPEKKLQKTINSLPSDNIVLGVGPGHLSFDFVGFRSFAHNNNPHYQYTNYITM